MKIALLILSVLGVIALPSSVLANERPKKPDNEILVGDYRLIGQLPDSGATYSGRVTVRQQGGALKVTRTINGKAANGTAAVEFAPMAESWVPRMRFSMNGKDFEATFLWRNDLDGYARLSGYVYLAKGETKSPGLEALFSSPPTPAQ
jgi:hypothetical protein